MKRTGLAQDLLAWVTSAQNWAVVHLSPRQWNRRRVRRQIAAEFIQGDGLEIGALHLPLPVPHHASVRYVDYKSTEELQKIYDRNYRFFSLAQVSVVDDGEVLSSIQKESVDFLIANHVIEHCEDPIGTLSRWLKVLPPGGILFMAVPDKRYTFDRDRPLTTVEHVFRDYQYGPAWSRDQHFEEYTRFVQRPSEWEIPARIASLKENDVRIHFHVWTSESFKELLVRCMSELRLPFSVEAQRSVANEFIVILRRTEPRAAPAAERGTPRGEVS